MAAVDLIYARRRSGGASRGWPGALLGRRMR